MNEHPLDDLGSEELLAAHLRRRGDRPAPAGLTRTVLARVAETTPDRRWRLTLSTWRPRMALAAGAVVVVLVASLLLVAPPAPRVGVSPTPVTPSSTAQPGLVWDPTQRALTPPEFLRVLASRPRVGTVLIVDDQIAERLVRCRLADDCPNGRLVNADLVVSPPPGGHLQFDTGSDIPGPLAIQVGADSQLTFLGSVLSNGLRLAFKAQDLVQRNAMGGLFVIPGWIYPRGPFPCPSPMTTPAPLPTSELGLVGPHVDYCAPAYLTDSDPGVPPYEASWDLLALPVPRDAYAPAAPDGAALHAIFLVRDWAGYGEVLAHLEPLTVPGNDAEPTPSPTPSATPAATVVLSLDELMAQARGGGLPPGSIALVDVPDSAVTDRWAPGVTHSCGQICAEWWLTLGAQRLAVVVSMQAPMPARPVGIQAFYIEPDGSLRALGPATTGPDGRPSDALTIATDGSLAVVHGWLRSGPVLPCPRRLEVDPVRHGLLGEPLEWSQCDGTWILPSSADPWAGPPNNVTATDGSGTITIGDLSVPGGTLHVQDGAGDATIQPREGSWLVRGVITNACPSWASCPPPIDGVTPATHVTWWELVGPVLDAPLTTTGPSPAPASPDQPASPTVWTSAQLRSVMVNGPLAVGTVAIVDATITRDATQLAFGFIEDIRVYWASNTSLGDPPTTPGRFVVRVRADRTLDYLGPARLDDAGAPFAGSAVQASALAPGAPAALYVVHGWRHQERVIPCASRSLAPGQREVTGLAGQPLSFYCVGAYVLATAAEPREVAGGGYTLTVPTGSLHVQTGAFDPVADLTTPVEGVFVVRYVPCPVTPAFDSCDVFPVTPEGSLWELVGTVTSPASVSP